MAESGHNLPAEAMKRKVFTLAFIINGNQVLLGLKKRGFGKGLWNGFGGKVEPGEDIVSATSREIEEECGLKVENRNLEKAAVIEFECVGDPIILQVHLFRTIEFTGQVTESDEMLPEWYDVHNVPHDQMWPDSEIWYPLFLQGHKFRAYFLCQGYGTILAYKVTDLNDESIILEELKRNQ